MIMIAFSVVSVSMILVLGLVMYLRFSMQSREEAIQNTQKLMEQTETSLEDYLVSMRQISDAVYYNVIKEHDLSREDQSIHAGMNLLYEANRDSLRSIAVYNDSGSLVCAEPVALQKEDPNVTRQPWFRDAASTMENLHFSTPHIQNLFDDATMNYYWVISLSRAVELTSAGAPRMGVLLVDMDYSGISRMMEQVNKESSGEYYYLCDRQGDIIYHPRQIQISEGICKENQQAAAQYKEGVYTERFEGENRQVIVSTISYTGWKLVGVIPHPALTYGTVKIRYFIILILLLMAMTLMIINRVVSVWISSPILKLNGSVKDYEAGEQPRIYIGGSPEIRHLGQSIQNSYEQIDGLMKEIVREQTERRKSELEALQSQIHPHFLYNTLESITWMIEGERNEEASFMITQLARLFRISLSRGRTVISIREEIQHAQSYMNIQKIRYKNAFTAEFDVDAELENCCTVKLILQPLLENAISYGVNEAEETGRIRVTGRKEKDSLVLTVSDNGAGMTQEEAGAVLKDTNPVRKRGSGVGLVNVNHRIQILFGREYGVSVKSVPDEGTDVSIRLPVIEYTEENRKILERGHLFYQEEMLKNGREKNHEIQ